MIRLATLVFALLLGTALANGASINLLTSAAPTSKAAPHAALLARSWSTIKVMFR